MKLKTILLMLALALPVRGQITNIDTTTVTISAVSNMAYISIPGVGITNLPYFMVNSNNIAIGDPARVAYAKINANFAYLMQVIATNYLNLVNTNQPQYGVIAGSPLQNQFTSAGSNYIYNLLTNFMGSGGSGGGLSYRFANTNWSPGIYVLNTTNIFFGTNGLYNAYLAQAFGAGNDLTITNTFTLVGTNYYLTLGGLNPPPFTTLTNTGGGWYPGGGGATNASYTNVGTVYPVPPIICTNSSPPYYPYFTNGNIIALTNGCGFVEYTNTGSTNPPLGPFGPTCTNTAGPYTLDYITNGVAVYTNACGQIYLGNTNLCPNINGPYFAATNYGVNALTNYCGNVLYVIPMVTNYFTVVSGIAITNATNNLTLFNSAALPALSTGYQLFGAIVGDTNGVYLNLVYTNMDNHYLNITNCPDTLGNGVYIADSSDVWGALHWTNANTYTITRTRTQTGAGISLAFHLSLALKNPASVLVDYTTTNNASAIGWTESTALNGVSWLSGSTGFAGQVLPWMGSVFSYYKNNQWGFYVATNSITFNPATDTITTSGRVFTNSFLTAPFLPSSLVWTDAVNDVITFTTTNIGGWYVDTNGVLNLFGGGAINPTNISIIITAPPAGPPATPPALPPAGYPCQTYFSVTIGGVCKTLINGWSLESTVHTLNAQYGGPLGGPNHWDIDTAGNVNITLLAGGTNQVCSWASTTATNGWNCYWSAVEPARECESCATRSMTPPVRFY